MNERPGVLLLLGEPPSPPLDAQENHREAFQESPAGGSSALGLLRSSTADSHVQPRWEGTTAPAEGVSGAFKTVVFKRDCICDPDAKAAPRNGLWDGPHTFVFLRLLKVLRVQTKLRTAAKHPVSLELPPCLTWWRVRLEIHSLERLALPPTSVAF